MGNELENIKGEPFFVTKERFPLSPSKKVALDIADFF